MYRANHFAIASASTGDGLTIDVSIVTPHFDRSELLAQTAKSIDRLGGLG